MEWLEAMLAFAVVMIVLSTMVSVVTEAFHRVLRLREKGFSRMVAALYEQVVEPRLADRLERTGATADEFVHTITSARYHPWSDKKTRWDWLTALTNVSRRIVPRTVNASQVKSLSTLEFIERLAETPAGQVLVDEAGQRGEDFKKDFLRDLVSKYEDYGETASEYFARRARLTSVLLSLALAFALGINILHLFTSLLTDKGVRDAWIAQGEEVTAQWERQRAEIQQLLTHARATEGLTAQESRTLIEANIQELRNATTALQNSGLAIGAGHRPWANPEWNNACGAENPRWTALCPGNASALIKWLLVTLFSGLAIGFGGPFWFDTYRKLGALTGIVRDFQSATQQPGESSARRADGDGPPQTADALVIAVFDAASRGQAMALHQSRSPRTGDDPRSDEPVP